VAFWIYMNTVGVACLFYTIFIGVIGRRDFTIICPILPKSYRDSADFLPCDFLTAPNPNPNPNTNSTQLNSTQLNRELRTQVSDTSKSAS